jgi:hypothetical protein
MGVGALPAQAFGARPGLGLIRRVVSPNLHLRGLPYLRVSVFPRSQPQREGTRSARRTHEDARRREQMGVWLPAQTFGTRPGLGFTRRVVTQNMPGRTTGGWGYGARWVVGGVGDEGTRSARRTHEDARRRKKRDVGLASASVGNQTRAWFYWGGCDPNPLPPPCSFVYSVSPCFLVPSHSAREHEVHEGPTKTHGDGKMG